MVQQVEHSKNYWQVKLIIRLMFKKKDMNYIIILLLLVCFLGFVYFTRTYLLEKKPFQDTLLEENLTISNRWLEIKSEGRLTTERDRQVLSLVLENPFKKTFPNEGITTPDGEIVNPDIELVDSEGKIYSLKYFGGIGESRVHYGYIDGLPKSKKYTAIRLKSSLPIKVKKIIWTNYYYKDII